MTGLIGADVADLEDFARTLDRSAGEIDHISARASYTLMVAGWIGADIDDVRSRWNRDSRRGLSAAATDLRDAAKFVRFEAEQQQRASDAGWYYAKSITDQPGLLDRLGMAWSAGVSVVAGLGRSGAGFVTRLGALAISVEEQLGTLELRVGALLVNSNVETLYVELTYFAAYVGPVLTMLTPDGRAFAELTRLSESLVSVVPEPSRLGDREGKPLSVQDVIADTGAVENADQGAGHIDILTVRSANGQLSYVVQIPGTEIWSPFSDNPADSGSDWETGVAGTDTALAESVKQAMKDAGLPPGAHVLLAGHSLGGLTAAQLAADPSFRSAYHVDGVVAVAAGVDKTLYHTGVTSLSLRSKDDMVSNLNPLIPGLMSRADNQYVLDSPTSAGGLGLFKTFSGEHNLSNYNSLAAQWANQGKFDGFSDRLPSYFDPGSVVMQAQGFQASREVYLYHNDRLSN